MMNQADMATIAAVGVLAAAASVFLAGVGVSVPPAVLAVAPLAAGIALFGLRAYIAFVGEQNTRVDEKLALAESLIASARDAVAKK